LAHPSPRNLQSLEVNERLANALGSPLKANNGLHMAVEHQVITRDMPNALIVASAKKLDYELQGWSVPDSQLSMIQPRSSHKNERYQRRDTADL
jgi:hypothetical protein